MRPWPRRRTTDVSEPRYRKIEFVTDPRIVRERLESGWDWVGVDAEGEFVLGYPGATLDVPPRQAITIVHPGATEGDHGVRIDAPLAPAVRRWHAREVDAEDDFVSTVDFLRRSFRSRPSMALVQRIENRAVVEEVFLRA
jgi:hypothetical protein